MNSDQKLDINAGASHDGLPNPFKLKVNILFAVIMTLAFALVQYKVILTGNLAEDAFILFEYVNHFVQGFGISYNIDAVHVEGATDFLWFFFLSILGFLGISPPVAAAILNSLGFGMIGWVISSVFMNSYSIIPRLQIIPSKPGENKMYDHQPRSLWVQYCAWLILMLSLLFSHFAFAAYAGFSTALYAGIIVLGLKRLSDKDSASFRDVPLIGILLGLFRPDGVVIGAVMVFIKFYFSIKEGEFKKLLTWALIAFVIGVSYFFWRMNYFGELLPLPLYVKSDTQNLLIGYYLNLKWVYDNIHWFLILGVIIAVTRRWADLYVLAPGAILFLALTTSTQTQNVGDRYQMPLFISMVFYVAMIWHRISWRIAQPAMLILMITAIQLIMCYDDLPQKMNKRLWGQHYVAPFAKLIDPYVDDSTIMAVTEAGRIAYFNNAHVIDLVGLNTPELSKTPVDLKYVEDLKPDMLFFYHDMMIKPVNAKKGEVVELDSDHFQEQVYLKKLYNTDDPVRGREIHAASVAVDYLYHHSRDYFIYLMYMPEAKDHRHVFAVRKDYQYHDEIFAALKDAQKLPSDYYHVMELNSR